MEPHAPLFPSFAAPLGELYGASSFRAAEAHASALELDDLDREELALERTVRALVDRPAPPPIGLKFHQRAAASAAQTSYTLNSSSASVSSVSAAGVASQRLQRGGVAPVGTQGSRLGSGVQTTRGYHGDVAADDEEDDEDADEMDDMEEDEEDDEEEDELEELDEDDEEEEDDDELFAGERAPDDSMDLSM